MPLTLPPVEKAVRNERRRTVSLALWLLSCGVGTYLVTHGGQPKDDPHTVPSPPHPAQTAPTFPLKVSPNGRYLVGQNGVPFRVQSEAAWIMATRGTPSSVDTYLADRKARGFNAFILMNLVHPNGTFQWWTETNANGDAPFTTPDDFSTPNDAYFNFIELIIDKAAAQGFAVEFFYTYVGYAGGDQGWWSVIGNSQ